MKAKNKAINYFITTLFIASIILPTVFSNKTGGEISLSENRYLSKFPTIFSQGRIVSGVIPGIENWINDNAGGRKIALAAYENIMYRMFHIYPQKYVYEGSDKWLYLAINSEDGKDLQTVEEIEKDLVSYNLEVRRITEELSKENIEFTMMLWPQKYSVYPEYLPPGFTKTYQLTQHLDYVGKMGLGSTVDIKSSLPALIEAKQTNPVFYKAYDTGHWNNFGAFIGYSQLMQQAQNHLPEIKILTNDDFVVSTITRDTKTSFGFYASEEDKKYELIGGHHSISDPTFFYTIPFKSEDPWRSYSFYRNSNNTLPKAIIVGDSYIWQYLLPVISESFSELAFINVLDINNLNLLIGTIHPDIVMAAFLEGYFPIQTFSSYHYENVPTLDAIVVSVAVPSYMVIGKEYNLTIDIQNTGTETWTRDSQVKLAIFINGQDSGNRILLPENFELTNGQVFSFTIDGYKLNTYQPLVIGFQMVQEGNIYFGEKGQYVINVK